MQMIGYSLVNDGGQEVDSWGDVMGQCPAPPNYIRLPNGDTVHGVKAGAQFGGYRLVERWGTYASAPSAAFDGQKVVRSFQVDTRLVVDERERRLGSGFDYDFGDARGVHRIGTSPQDMAGWDEVSKIAQAAVLSGQPNLPIAIVTNTGAVTVTAMEWQGVLIAAARFRQPIWAASFALQAMNPIPADYTADKWWTSAS